MVVSKVVRKCYGRGAEFNYCTSGFSVLDPGFVNVIVNNWFLTGENLLYNIGISGRLLEV